MAEHTFRLSTAVYLLLMREDKILMLKRANTGYKDGQYSLVAGRVDGGETIRQTMAREAFEEAGISITPDSLNVVHVLNRREEDGNEWIDFFLTTSSWHGEIRNAEPHKCSDLSWFPVTALPTSTIPYIRHVITCYQNNMPYSEFGW